MEGKILFWEVLFGISSISARDYLFKVSNWSIRIRWEDSLRLKIQTLERYQWRCCVLIVDCECTSNVFLIVDFEQAYISSVHIGKTNTFKYKIGYIMPYVVVF